MDKPHIDPASAKGKNLESPLKIAKNHFSNIIEEIAGSPDRVSSIINKVTPSPKSKSKSIMKDKILDESDDLSPFMSSSKAQNLNKKGEFLPAIGAAR